MADRKVTIVGSGPAGLTAALYAARANLKPLLVEGLEAGGQLMLTTMVENWPGFRDGIMGPDLMAEMRAQAERFGTRVIGEDIVRCDFSKKPFTLHSSEGAVKAHAVIIATGATANWLGLNNELRLATNGGGVSACAVCDGALPGFRNQPLAVVGGGDTAMEEASYLTKFGSTVYVIHRRDEFRASKTMQERIFNAPNAKVIWNSVVTDVLGNDHVEGVRLKDSVTGKESDLAVRGLFIAIGHTPATKFLQGSGLTFDDKGYVRLGTRSSATNIEGVFAAGDVRSGSVKRVASAVGEGAMVVQLVHEYLKGM